MNQIRIVLLFSAIHILNGAETRIERVRRQALEVSSPSPPANSSNIPIFESTTQHIDREEIRSLDELTSGQRTTVRVLLYVTAGWVFAWCLASCAVNTVFNEFSLERGFEVYQELGFSVLFVFLGAFTYQIDSEALCVTTQLFVLFFINFVASLFFVKVFLSTCLIRSLIQRVTLFHWSIAFLLPLLTSAVATIAGYFSCQEFFGLQITHCFVHVRTKQFWVYTMPVWITFLALNLVNLYAFTICKNTRLDDANLSQLYWAFKTCKVTNFLFAFTCTAYFSLMFALDLQTIWLHCIYFVTTLLLGPIVFVSHTFTHVQTCIPLFALTSLPFYKPCDPPPSSAQEEQFGIMFSLRMRIPLLGNALEQQHPNLIHENIMEQALIIETPPLFRRARSTTQRRPRDNAQFNIANIKPPPVVNWS